MSDDETTVRTALREAYIAGRQFFTEAERNKARVEWDRGWDRAMGTYVAPPPSTTPTIVASHQTKRGTRL